MPVLGESFEQTLMSASPDVLREMIRAFAQQMMNAEAEARCGTGYGEVSPGRDHRAGDLEAADRVVLPLVPGAPPSGGGDAGLGGCHVVPTGVSTRRVQKLAAALGVTSLSKSEVSGMAQQLDALVESFRNRSLHAGPYTFVWIDALTRKVREGGRTAAIIIVDHGRLY